MIKLLSTVRRTAPRWLPMLLMLGLMAVMFAGCETDTPQNTFDAKGEVAEDQRRLFYIAMWPAIAVMILVMGVIFVACLRFRERDSSQPPPRQVHGNTRLELAWTIAPAFLLLIVGIPMVQSIYDLGREPADDAYIVDVIGQRYAWEFQYPAELDDDGFPLSTINEAHVPAGREINFRLRSIDVIHSFWVPKLGGKRDVMPCNARPPETAQDILNDPKCDGGSLNKLWLVADEPGTFVGQCAEYCGLNHALMSLTIHADAEDDFEAWVDEMLSDGETASVDDDGGEPAGTPEATEGS